jgi:uncharacterized protein (DUF736 family)
VVDVGKPLRAVNINDGYVIAVILTVKEIQMAENKLNLQPGDMKLFPNTRKTKDSQPDFQGQAMVADGTLVYASGWSNTSQNTGQQWLKIQFGDPVQDRENAPRPTQNNDQTHQPVAESIETIADDIPF